VNKAKVRDVARMMVSSINPKLTVKKPYYTAMKKADEAAAAKEAGLSKKQSCKSNSPVTIH
jgi:hypothetical protein